MIAILSFLKFEMEILKINLNSFNRVLYYDFIQFNLLFTAA